MHQKKIYQNYQTKLLVITDVIAYFFISLKIYLHSPKNI